MQPEHYKKQKKTKRLFSPKSQTPLNMDVLCDTLICWGTFWFSVACRNTHQSLTLSGVLGSVPDVTKSRLCKIFQQLAPCVLSLGTCLCGRARPGAVCLFASSVRLWLFWKSVWKTQHTALHWLLIVYIVQLEKMQEPLIVHFVALFVCFCQVCLNITSEQITVWYDSPLSVNVNVNSFIVLAGG